MKLDSQWRTIARRAWSVRLLALAIVMTAVEVMLPFISGRVPTGILPWFTLVVACAALVARHVAQKDVP